MLTKITSMLTTHMLTGASVTSATLCDGIIASDQASFLTPFKRLGIPPEGCSSVHFARVMRPDVARLMLYENLKLTAAHAKEAGMVIEVRSFTLLRESTFILLYFFVCIYLYLLVFPIFTTFQFN